MEEEAAGRGQNQSLIAQDKAGGEEEEETDRELFTRRHVQGVSWLESAEEERELYNHAVKAEEYTGRKTERDKRKCSV